MTETTLKKPVAKHNSKRVVHVAAQPNETDHEAMARHLLQYPVQAADTIGTYLRPPFNEIGTADLIVALQKQVMAVNQDDMKGVEGMLISQAHTLNILFHRLAQRAQAQEEGHWFELFMKLGLRAQNQCARTLETLSAIKNPPNVAFVKQANVGNNVQVNNGSQAGPPAPIDSTPQLEHTHGNYLDTRTATAASGNDSAMATVGEIHRTEDGRG